MIITDQKIEVTEKMMADANMTRGQQIGVPVDPQDKSEGLEWKHVLACTDQDFDKIETYFLLKKS